MDILLGFVALLSFGLACFELGYTLGKDCAKKVTAHALTSIERLPV